MSDIQERSNGHHHSGQPGVTWNNTIQRWRVEIRRGAASVFLGSFREGDKILAIAMRREAESLPADELPALRERYGKKSRPRRDNTPPASPEDGLVALYRQALDADSQLRQANREASEAAGRAHRAEECSIEAWNKFADALKETGRNIDSGFIRSKLGALLDREES